MATSAEELALPDEPVHDISSFLNAMLQIWDPCECQPLAGQLSMAGWMETIHSNLNDAKLSFEAIPGGLRIADLRRIALLLPKAGTRMDDKGSLDKEFSLPLPVGVAGGPSDVACCCKRWVVVWN